MAAVSPHPQQLLLVMLLPSLVLIFSQPTLQDSLLWAFACGVIFFLVRRRSPSGFIPFLFRGAGSSSPQCSLSSLPPSRPIRFSFFFLSSPPFLLPLSSRCSRPFIHSSSPQTCFLTRIKESLYKLGLYARIFQFMLLSKDKKWEAGPPVEIDPKLLSRKTSPEALEAAGYRVVGRRSLIGIRHGESMWNDVFNKGHHRSRARFLIFFLPRMLYALLTEAWIFLCGMRDSWFYDSPASPLGISQSEHLAEFLKTDSSGSPEIAFLRGDELNDSIVVSSNLRRCITTGLVGLRQRFRKPGAGRMILLTSLQEISPNADTLCITPPKTQPVASFVDHAYTKHSEGKKDVVNLDQAYAKLVDPSQNTGNKSVKSNGLIRLKEFATWLFEENRVGNVIVCGHSLW